MAKILINEWDGDRSSDLGGFDVDIVIGTDGANVLHNSYNNEKERKNALSSARRKAEKLSKSLGFKVEEDLYD